MAITYSTPASYTPPPGDPTYTPAPGTLSFNVTVNDTPNRALYVEFQVGSWDRTINATCDGVAMLPIEKSSTAILFYLWNPASGTPTVEINWTYVPGSYEAVAMAVPVYGVSQVVPYRNLKIGYGTGTTASITVPLGSANDRVLAFLNSGYPTSVVETDCEEIGSVVGNLYGFGRITAAFGTVEEVEWSMSPSSGWVGFSLALRAAGDTGTPVIPCIQEFDGRAITDAIALSNGSIDINDDWQASAKDAAAIISTNAGAITAEQGPYGFYYETEWMSLLANRLGASHEHYTLFHNGAKANVTVWNEASVSYNNYIPYAYQIFTNGAATEWERNGQEGMRDLIEIMQLNAPYANETYTSLEAPDKSRECSYHIRAHLDAERVGLPPVSGRLDALIEFAYGHLEYWFVDFGWEGVDIAVQPFMVGLTARALIQAWNRQYDSRLVPLLKAACDFLRSDSWHAPTIGYLYQINPECDENSTDGPRSTVGTPLLNNLIGPMNTWVGLQTGNETYIKYGDECFAGSAINGAYAVDGIFAAKQTNQAHTWSNDFLQWRNAFYNNKVSRSGRLFRRSA